MPSYRVSRPKSELISQKDDRRSTFLLKSHRQPLVFDKTRCKISIDNQKQPPYTSAIEKQCLININFINVGQRDKQEFLGNEGEDHKQGFYELLIGPE
jgi:hypothetical protein